VLSAHHHVRERSIASGGGNTKKSSKKIKNGKYDLDKQTELIVFGDSLTDVGNVNKFFPCNLNPVVPDLYCGPRASNGPLAIDIINEVLGFSPLVASDIPDPVTGSRIPVGGNNYAFASATASTETGQLANDFATQVQLYRTFLQLSQATATPSIDATTLFYTEFGGNDLIGAFNTEDPATVFAFIGNAVKDYIKNVEALVELGACSILVGGPPDVGKAPIAAGFRSAVSELSTLFTTLLKAAIEGVTITNDDDSCYGIVFIDIFSIVNEVGDDERFQEEFPDPEAVCNNRFMVPCDQCNSVLIQIGFTPIPITPSGICFCDVPVLPEDEIDFVCEAIPSYDELHPTTRYNDFTAEFILKFLEESAAE
jgi:hypothetical protein